MVIVAVSPYYNTARDVFTCSGRGGGLQNSEIFKNDIFGRMIANRNRGNGIGAEENEAISIKRNLMEGGTLSGGTEEEAAIIHSLASPKEEKYLFSIYDRRIYFNVFQLHISSGHSPSPSSSLPSPFIHHLCIIYCIHVRIYVCISSLLSCNYKSFGFSFRKILFLSSLKFAENNGN